MVPVEGGRPMVVELRRHAPGQQPQMPPGKHLLETGDISIPDLYLRADHRETSSQVRTHDRNPPRIKGRHSHLLVEHR